MPTPTAPANQLSLVNLAARQRMLSQRMILQTLLAAEGRATMLDAAQQSFQLFCASHQQLMQTIHQLEPQQAALVRQTYQGPQGVGPVIDLFMHHMRAALGHAERQSPALSQAVNELVANTDSVLAALNTATTAFDQIARQKEDQLMKELAGIVTDIQSVAREAKVVTFNAQVIAARAGEQGRGFAVVANVLAGITQEIDRQSKKALQLTQRTPVTA
jgi:methyl-accepting chemotaxis protein